MYRPLYCCININNKENLYFLEYDKEGTLLYISPTNENIDIIMSENIDKDEIIFAGEIPQKLKECTRYEINNDTYQFIPFPIYNFSGDGELSPHNYKDFNKYWEYSNLWKLIIVKFPDDTYDDINYRLIDLLFSYVWTYSVKDVRFIKTILKKFENRIKIEKDEYIEIKSILFNYLGYYQESDHYTYNEIIGNLGKSDS